MNPAQPQSVSLVSSDLEASVRFFSEVLGFTVREEIKGSAELYREGLTLRLFRSADEKSAPMNEALHLFVGVKRNEAAWQRDRRLSEQDVPGPKLLQDGTYRYETRDPSENPLILHAAMYRGTRTKRARGKTRRFRPKGSPEDIPPDG